MKIAFLFKKDSHLKAVKSTALRICAQYHCESTFIGIDSQCLCSHDSYSVIYIAKENLKVLSEYDYVIACLGGYLLNQTVAVLRDTNTKVVSIFPGIVSHYQLDAFLSRLNADQVWLNSKADFDLYNKICQLLNRPNNSILYGMSWLDLVNPIYSGNFPIETNKAIIFEQTEILYSSSRKKRFLDVLEKIIQSNPEINFKYKIRNNSIDNYFLQLRKYLEKFENVEVVEEIHYKDVIQSYYYLSISSSALIEGVAYGKASYIIDQTLLDNDSREFYSNSHMELMSFYLRKNSITINDYWCKQRVSLPIDHVDLLSIRKNRIFTVFRNRSYNLIRLFLIKLAFFYPKTAYLFINRSKIMAIQKSLEYLSM